MMRKIAVKTKKEIKKAVNRIVNRTPKNPRGKAYAPTTEEWRTWLEQVRKNAAPKHFLIVYLCRLLAERIGAVVQLRRCHIKLDLKEVHIPSNIQKGADTYARNRIIYLDEDSATFMRKVADEGIKDIRKMKTSMMYSGDQLIERDQTRDDFHFPEDENAYLFPSFDNDSHLHPATHGDAVQFLV